jgi:hypothetical protein
MDELKLAIEGSGDSASHEGPDLTVPERPMGFQLMLSAGPPEGPIVPTARPPTRPGRSPSPVAPVPRLGPAVLLLNGICGSLNVRSSYLQRRRWEWRLGPHMHLPLTAQILMHSKLAAGYLLADSRDGHQGVGRQT